VGHADRRGIVPIMAPPAVPRAGRPFRRRSLAVVLAALIVGTSGLAVVSLARSAGWSLPGGGVAAIASAAPTASPPATAQVSPPATAQVSPPATAQVSPPPSGEAPPPVSPTTAERRGVGIRTQLQARLDADRRRLGIPGVSVTIIFRDGSSWTGTSGLADVTAGTRVTANTAFALASISKTYTAALIVALAGDGRINLTAPALTYLPGSKLDRRITVRMLLDHTSGLDDFFLHPPIDKALLAKRQAAWSPSRSLRYVGKRYFAPGAGWHYSNTNYLYLGLIAEKVTGVSLAAALRERFLTPLDLDQTWYQAVDRNRSSLAHGYRFNGSKVTAPPIDLSDGTGVAPFRSVVTAAAGAGSIAATSGDVARWARSLYDGTAIGDAQTAVMLEDTATTAAYKPRVPYGLGVQVFPIGGRLSVGHSGRLLGFRTAVRHIPGEATTIAVLTNQSRADPAIIVGHLLAIVFAPSPACNLCGRPT
jgi:D-alanyl-D-alanine carboxypeptidase